MSFALLNELLQWAAIGFGWFLIAAMALYMRRHEEARADILRRVQGDCK